MVIDTLIHSFSERNLLLRIPLWLRTLSLFAVSFVGILVRDPYVNSVIIAVCIGILLSTGFLQRNRHIIVYVVIATSLSLIIWTLFSRVPGETLIIWPWGTHVSDATLGYFHTNFAMWWALVFTGLVFFLLLRENEIVSAARKALPERYVRVLTIAITTIGFSLQDIERTKRCVRARGITGAPKVLLYTCLALFTYQLKRIEILDQALHFESDETY